MNGIDFINVDPSANLEVDQFYILNVESACDYEHGRFTADYEFLGNHVNLTTTVNEKDPNCATIEFEFSGSDGNVTKFTGDFEVNIDNFTFKRDEGKFITNGAYKVTNLKLNDNDFVPFNKNT